MIWAYDTRNGNAVQMIGRPQASMGRSLSGGAWEGAAGPAAAVVAIAAAAFGAVYWFRTRRR